MTLHGAAQASDKYKGHTRASQGLHRGHTRATVNLQYFLKAGQAEQNTYNEEKLILFEGAKVL